MIPQQIVSFYRVLRTAGFAALALAALVLMLPQSARCAPPITKAAASPQSPPGEPPLPVFELHSGFWLNLHHFLYQQARLANGNSTTLASLQPASPDQGPVSLAGFSPDEAQAWQAAVAFYGRDLATRDLLNSDMEIIHKRLIELENCADLAGKSSPDCNSGLSPQLVDALDRAAPVYRNHWWAAQDRANRQWIAGVAPMIRQMGEQLSDQLSDVYEKLWPLDKVRVDVVWYAGSDGAYTTTDPVHLTISSGDPRNQGLYGFEVLFHEASYAVAGPLNETIDKDFRDRDKPIPRDLWQALVFYTTSDIIQRDITEGILRPSPAFAEDHTRYLPYGERFGLYAGRWRQFRGLLDLYWRPYLEGRVSFESAIAGMAAAQ